MDNDLLEKIIGEFEHIIYQSDNYMVSKFKSEDGSITVTGPSFDIEKGQLYELSGNYVEHPKYGFQFNIIKIEKCLSTNREQIISFLKSNSFKGIGKKAAEKIYEYFKDQTLYILKEDVLRIHEVDLTTKQYLAIEEGFAGLKDPKNDIMFYLASNGFNSLDSQKIFNRFKLATIEVSKDNPFKLYNDVYGINFEKVKRFAQTIDFEDKENKYKEAYLIYVLTETCFNRGDLYVLKDELQDISKLDNYEEVLENCINHNYIVNEDNRLYLFNDYNDELFISNYLTSFNNNLAIEDDLIFEGIENSEKELDIKYDSNQKKAITSFFKNGISIIVGGPGTGKTTIVKAMVKMFNDYFPFNNLIAIAPTGRAAKRINEICGCEAKTIHSLLRWNLETNTFVHDIDNPIMYDALIIDEFSMVDNNLFACLLKACQFVKKICIIGDENQLPSIRPGFILNDLIASNKFALTKLSANYRQKNGNEIISLADDVIRNDLNLSKYNKDISFIDIKKQSFDIVELIKKDIDEGYNLDEIQVLAPMYRSNLGIDNLNIMLQAAFNPNEGQNERVSGKYTYRVNDKILQLKNRPNDDVYNGDIGKLIDIDFKEKCFTVDFNNVLVFYNYEELIDISLAYAMSVHKAQGSEYQVVYFVLTRSNMHMLNKKLIYTAITRAKSKLVIIGEESVLKEGICTNMRPRRSTLLNRLINS